MGLFCLQGMQKQLMEMQKNKAAEAKAAEPPKPKVFIYFIIFHHFCWLVAFGSAWDPDLDPEFQAEYRSGSNLDSGFW